MANSKAKFKGGQTGFTLMEILVYVALVGIVAGAITGFGIWAIRAGAKIKMENEVMNNARRAMETMVYEIKKSAGVYTPTSNFEINPGQLSLEQMTESIPQEEKTFVDFFQCGEALCLKRERAAPIALTNEKVRLTNLQFKQLVNSVTSPSIQISLSLEGIAAGSRPEGQASISLTTTANLRSYSP